MKTTIQKNYSSHRSQHDRSQHGDYTAQYLVLLRHHETTRALLFARDQRYLAELIDDGLMLDDLMRHSRECPPPRKVAEQAWASAPASVVCFELDMAEAEH